MRYADHNPGNDPAIGDVETVRVVSAPNGRTPREIVDVSPPPEPEHVMTIEDYRQLYRDPSSRGKSTRVLTFSNPDRETAAGEGNGVA